MTKSIEKTDYMPKTEEEQVAVWKTRLDSSKDFMLKNFKKNSERWRKMFKGEHWGKVANTKSDLIVVNYVYSILKSIIPQTYYQDPYFDVKADDPVWMLAEQLAEDALNEGWRQIKAKLTIKRVQLDQLVMGFGAAQLGYSFITENDYSKPNLDLGLDYSEMVKEDEAFFLRVSTNDILPDDKAKHFSEMKWLATRYYLPYKTAQEQFNIKGKLEPTSMHNLDYYSKYAPKTSDPMFKEIFQLVEIWQIQDLERDKFYYVTDGYDKFMAVQDNKYDFGFNTKLFWVNDCPDELLPISDVSQIEDLVMELNKTRTQLLNHRRKIQRKILYETGAFKTKEDVNRLLNDDDMQAVEMKDGALSSQAQRVLIVQPGVVPAEFYKIDEINKDDIYQVSGVGANQMAAEGTVAKTATESSIIERNANLRNVERIDAMNDYCETVGRCLLSIMQKFQNRKTSFYNRQKMQWVQFTNEDIAGNYSVSIKVGSMQRPNESMQNEILMNVMPKFIVMSNPDGSPVFNVQEIFRSIMKKSGFSETEVSKMINQGVSQNVIQNPNTQNVIPSMNTNNVIQNPNDEIMQIASMFPGIFEGGQL